MKIIPKLFVLAAEAITRGRQDYSCHALCEERASWTGTSAQYRDETPETNLFDRMYREGSPNKHGSYFDRDPTRDPTRQARKHRVWALLLAHELAKGPKEDRP